MKESSGTAPRRGRLKATIVRAASLESRNMVRTSTIPATEATSEADMPEESQVIAIGQVT